MAELLSEEAKRVIARRLGVADIVEREGWGSVPTRECGRVVAEAVAIAEEAMVRRSRGPRQP